MTAANPQAAPPSKADASADPTVHHEGARKKRAMQPASMQLNLTSMIDVIFQLLIYFIVTASFTQNEGVLAAKMPPKDGSGQPDIPPQELVIQIEPANLDYILRIEGDSVPVRDFTELARRLKELQFNPNVGQGVYKADDPVRIRPEGTVRWQHVVNAFNAAIDARYTNVGFAKPESNEQG